MRNAILCQCFGALGLVCFNSGIMLVYLLSLGMARSRVLTYLAVPSLSSALLLIPMAMLSDRFGKKKIGQSGALLLAAAFSALTLTRFVPDASRAAWVLACIVTYACGQSAMASGWFALLSPVVPSHMRGRFFGRLRLSWQLCGIVLSALASALLATVPGQESYTLIMGLVSIGLFLRIVFYRRVPELEREREPVREFMPALGTLLRHPGLMPFCAYVFLLALCVTGCPAIFGLVEKEILGFSDSRVVILGNVSMVGMLGGFALGGFIVDRTGTRPVFLACHFGYAALIAAFVLRSFLTGGHLLALIGSLHCLWGIVAGTASIAIATEVLSIIPARHKSLSTSMHASLAQAGVALSPLIGALALNSGALQESWGLSGLSMTAYDTILIAFAGMVLLLVVTLGLVPSVVGKSDWIPR